MNKTQYSSLVEAAQLKRHSNLNKSFPSLALDSLYGTSAITVLVRELDYVNQYITVDNKYIDEASNYYEQIAQHLVDKLKWPRDSIKILPQGSACTQTLIKAPDASKFDIDAVCSVDISRIEAYDPMRFFQEVGRALADWKANAKKRCWRIEFPNTRFYIEFTPSIPIASVPKQFVESVRFRPTDSYKGSALAVVDTPTKSWKTSNPEGMAKWVNDQTQRSVIEHQVLEKTKIAADNITPVPEQEVPLTDTLRIAIRLFKRHRDMAVRRGNLDSEFKPISIILVTLLTQCYEGLADTGARYKHPIRLLVDLAELLPNMIEERKGKYWVANPTVEGENFAERWNEDGGDRKEAFDTWCDLLISDLRSILTEQGDANISRRIREIFGCSGSTTTGPTSGGGLAPKEPTRVIPPPATRGLA